MLGQAKSLPQHFFTTPSTPLCAQQRPFPFLLFFLSHQAIIRYNRQGQRANDLKYIRRRSYKQYAPKKSHGICALQYIPFAARHIIPAEKISSINAKSFCDIFLSKKIFALHNAKPSKFIKQMPIYENSFIIFITRYLKTIALGHSIENLTASLSYIFSAVNSIFPLPLTQSLSFQMKYISLIPIRPHCSPFHSLPQLHAHIHPWPYHAFLPMRTFPYHAFWHHFKSSSFFHNTPLK